MTAWLDFAPTAFDRKARPVTAALFGRAEAAGIDGALFDAAGAPVAEALFVDVEALKAERETLRARLAELDALIGDTHN